MSQAVLAVYGGASPMTRRLTPLSGELHERAPSLSERSLASLARARERRRQHLRARMQLHPLRGALVYVGSRFIALLVIFDLCWALLVAEGARPAMAFYVLALAAAAIGSSLALISESIGPRDDAGDPTSWGTAGLNLRVLTGVTVILLAGGMIALGLHSERYGSTTNDPTATCVLPADGYGGTLVGVWHVVYGDCAK